jgi:Flp pilus assembly protein TadD
MQELLPQAYLLGLIVLLGGAAVLVGRQILRVRGDEQALARLSTAGPGGTVPSDSGGLYELASVQLRKRLYGQAVDTLKLALRRAQAEKAPNEARALIENAYGFALAAQNRYSDAIRHYRNALQARPEYPVALNNLGYALGKQGETEEARATYAKALSLEPANGTARKGLQTMERRLGKPSAGGSEPPGGGKGPGKGGGKGINRAA